MFDELIRALSRASVPFSGFLEEVWALWTRDIGRAVLLARWRWQEIPNDVFERAALLQRQLESARANHEIDQQVDTRLGAMGIFPSRPAASYGSYGPSVDPNHQVFLTTLATIRQHSGDPPTTPAFGERAYLVLTGQLDPVEALLETLPPLLRAQMMAAARASAMLGLGNFMQQQGIITAAYMLPRERIPSLLSGYV